MSRLWDGQSSAMELAESQFERVRVERVVERDYAAEAKESFRDWLIRIGYVKEKQ